MKEIKVSIILPVYNVENYIEKCLDSLLKQSLKEIEIIIINDGSTDNSLKKIEKYKEDERIIIINKKNEGLTKTRNTGLKIAQGKYVYHMDSDDYLESKDALEKMYNKSENDELDILIFDFYRETKGEKNYVVNIDVSDNQEILKENYIRDLIKGKWGMTVWSKLIKKDLFTTNNVIFPEDIFYGEDLITSLKLGYFAKRIGKLNEVLYNYVQHETQGTKQINREKRFSDSYSYYIKMEKFLKERNMYFKFKSELLNRKCRLYEKILAKKYKNTEIYKKIKKNLSLEEKEEFLQCEYYKKMNIIKKIRFRLRTN